MLGYSSYCTPFLVSSSNYVCPGVLFHGRHVHIHNGYRGCSSKVLQTIFPAGIKIEDAEI